MNFDLGDDEEALREAVEGVGLLHGVEVDRHFDHTQQRRVALGRGAAIADLVLGEGVAAGAAPQRIERAMQRRRKAIGAATVALQQMVGHALRRLGADARQATQRLDQFVEAGWKRH